MRTITPPSGLYLAGSTQLVTALPARDFDFVTWSGLAPGDQNPIALVMNQNYSFSANFVVKGFTDNFELGRLGDTVRWSHSGGAPWLHTSRRGCELRKVRCQSS